MTDGELSFFCNLHVYLFYEPRKKTAIRMLLQSSARLSCGKDQPMCLTWFDESLAWVLRKSLFYEFTTSACNSPLLKPFYGGLRGRFPCFAPIPTIHLKNRRTFALFTNTDNSSRVSGK